ncbi:dihydrolipoamide acetyltransferase family protein [Bacillus sp. S/N-304-OC-R1]|uniref:dihydrolipoamide acetyltransferase family protein n=1 Tax=Bacillus sp. S/N-304-OC-R1 TaxID=2758034 RepID=UPI001C8ECC6E|nr:dihydrolipoamide acetyltransferase family protein [Bacillus sp. S/N-304-OC-R1]MBY0120546.1 2-oxo acid dehydrogenase subunit E2 [Bacillus sp. S/N-304-OC-R1]
MEVKLHDIGEGMTEADINCFLVKPGDYVQADDPIIEVQTDKMTAEIPAPRAGFVREFKVQIGETVPVGTTLLILEETGSVNNKTTQSDLKSPSLESMNHHVVMISNQKKRILASPFTRKIARENGINIENVKGTGPAGRITDEDIYKMIVSKKEEIDIPIQINSNEQITPTEQPPTQADTIPFRGRRKQIAKKMVHSLYTIPHCTHFEEVDVTELIAFRTELKKMNQTISATAFFIKALSICLTEFPIFNARLDEENEVIVLQKDHHIGLAVDTEDGLIVPVIRNVNSKSIRSIHNEMKHLTEKALANKLSVKEITGGTFTISNVGPLGGSFGATPIIQHPEVALVSFHKTKKLPVVIDDQIVIRSMMNISMSFDHRVADGATAVRFTNRLTQLIQDPKLLMLELV